MSDMAERLRTSLTAFESARVYGIDPGYPERLIRDALAALAEVPRLQSDLRVAECGVAFGNVAVAERNLARAQVERLQRQHQGQADHITGLRAEVDRLRGVEQRVRALAEEWRYKGEFGWGPWQEGYGPDQEGYVLDHAASDLRAALDPLAVLDQPAEETR